MRLPDGCRQRESVSPGYLAALLRRHHLAFGATYEGGVLIGATPSFRRVEQFTRFTENGRDTAHMAQDRSLTAQPAGLQAPLQAPAADHHSRP